MNVKKKKKRINAILRKKKSLYLLSVGMHVMYVWCALFWMGGTLCLMECYAYGKILIGQHKFIWANPNEASGQTDSSPVQFKNLVLQYLQRILCLSLLPWLQAHLPLSVVTGCWTFSQYATNKAAVDLIWPLTPLWCLCGSHLKMPLIVLTAPKARAAC